MTKYILPLFALLLLVGCGDDRAAKDTKISLGCQAAIKALLSMERYDRTFEKIKTKKFSDVSNGRQVILGAVTKNKQYGYEQDEAVTCVFAEGTEFGPFGYKTSFEQLTFGDEIFGRKDGQIMGDMNDFLQITGAVEAAIQ